MKKGPKTGLRWDTGSGQKRSRTQRGSNSIHKKDKEEEKYVAQWTHINVARKKVQNLSNLQMRDPSRRYAVYRHAANRIAFLVAIIYCWVSAYCSTSPWILYPLTSLVLHRLLAILFAAYLCDTPLLDHESTGDAGFNAIFRYPAHYMYAYCFSLFIFFCRDLESPGYFSFERFFAYPLTSHLRIAFLLPGSRISRIR